MDREQWLSAGADGQQGCEKRGEIVLWRGSSGLSLKIGVEKGGRGLGIIIAASIKTRPANKGRSYGGHDVFVRIYSADSLDIRFLLLLDL